MIAYLAGRHEEAKTLLHGLEKEEPEAAASHRYLSGIDLWEGRSEDWLAEATASDRLRGDAVATAALDQLRPVATNPGALEAALLTQAQVAARRGGHWFELARVASLAGRRALAVDALGRACAAHEPGAVGAAGDLWLSRALDGAGVAKLCGGQSLE